MRQRAIRLGVAVVMAAGTLVGGAFGGVPVARADDPLFVDWSSLLPTLTDEYDPNSANECVAGRPTCVDKTIREMRRRFERLGRACDHNAVFALAYLRTTQTYKWAAETPGFFEDTPWVNHEDAVFAKYYFQAYDDWAAGRRDRVPQAWLVAFDAAVGRRVSGSGNLFLGMNAHVNRDLPYVLAAIGIIKPDGTSRKADHDKVNQFLNRVVDPLLAEEAARFDPAMDDARDPLLLGYTSTFQMLAAWRETAWRNAERLTMANDPATRARVQADIENYATAWARAIVTAFSYTWPLSTSAARDRWCGLHNGDAPPMAYAFGTPTAW
jgi:hypothetical protein